MIVGQRSLFIEINNWEMSHTLFPDSSTETGRRITLIGTTQPTHFINPCEAYIEIWESTSIPDYPTKINEEATEYVEYGQIGYYERDRKNDINTFANGVIGVNTSLFENILSTIKDFNLKTTKIKVELKLYGLSLGYEIEDDEWGDSKLLSILGVIYHSMPV